MNNKLLFLMVCLGAQSLDAAKRVCAPQAEENLAAQLTAAQERALELNVNITTERAQHVQREAQARRRAHLMLEQGLILRNNAQQAMDNHAPLAERAALGQDMQRYAQRLETEATEGSVRVYSQSLANTLRRDARNLRVAAGRLVTPAPTTHISFLAPQRQLFSTMPIATPSNSPQYENRGSDSSDTE